MIFIGYEEGTKAYCAYDSITECIHVFAYCTCST
jgi:hypothetical protein